MKPNFFILGGPRCGTTAMSIYLGCNPHIFISTPKELHFFNTDLNFRWIRNERAYYRMFQEARSEHLAVGEASPYYLYSKNAVVNILHALPSARLIAMVRNPVDTYPSLHALNLLTLGEDVSDLARAWDLQHLRRNGHSLPKHCPDRQLLIYGDVCSFGEQVDRLYRTAPRERIHVVVFDDLKRDPRGTYRKVLEFLGVPDDGRHEFAPYNERRSVRSNLVAEMILGAALVKRALRINRSFGWLGRAERTNSRPLHCAISPDLQERLREYFRPDVERLSHILGRDLMGWVSPELAEFSGRQAPTRAKTTLAARGFEQFGKYSGRSAWSGS